MTQFQLSTVHVNGEIPSIQVILISEAIRPKNCTQLLCSKCKRADSIVLGRCHAYTWGYVLQCSTCRHSWISCYECSKAKPIMTTKRLNEHSSYHRKNDRKNANNENNFEDTSDDNFHGTFFDDASSVELQATNTIGIPMEASESPFDHINGVKFTEVLNASCLGFNGIANINFFHCYSRPEGGHSGLMSALAFLVKQSQTRIKYALPTHHHRISSPLEHIILQLRLAHLSLQISAKPRHLLPFICGKIHDVGYENGWVTCSRAAAEIESSSEGSRMDNLPYDPSTTKGEAHLWGLRIPRLPIDMRRFYGDNECSIKENLPYPQNVHSPDSNHACVSIEQCIRHFMAHKCSRLGNIDQTFELGESIDHPTNSPRAKELVEQAKRIHGADFEGIIAYIILWSDDCDVGNFGDQHVFVQTCTVCCPTTDGNILLNTFPVGIGTKGVSHEVLESYITKSLATLRSPDQLPYYVGKLNQNTRMCWLLMCYLGDQPQRRASNGLAFGIGTYSARWLVSANHLRLYGYSYDKSVDNTQAEGVLPSCKNCLEFMRTYYANDDFSAPLPTCSVCLNWDALLDSPLTLLDTPNDYPVTNPMNRLEHTSSDNGQHIDEYKMKTFRITYQQLCEAVTAAFQGIRSGNWTKGTMVVFLKVEGLSTEVIEKCYRNAINAKGLDNAIGAVRAELQEDQAENPEDFLPPLMEMWKRRGLEIPLSLHIDVIMHLIFLGMVKSSHSLLQECLTRRGSNKAFIRENAGYLRCFFKQYKVDWLTIMAYTSGKLGAWNSKEYLGFSRLMPWFYQNIKEVIADTPEDMELPPEKNQAAWTMKQNKYWLRIRGLKPPKTKRATEFRHRVADELQKIPVAQVLEMPNIDEEDVDDLIACLSELLKCVMCSKVTSKIVAQTEYAVRLFISAYDNLDRKLRTKGEKPSVISSFNFMSLLNLPGTMQTFGPLRHLWEGKYQGEAFLQKVKATMTQGLRTNWQRNLLKNLLRDMAFENIYQSMEMENSPCNSQARSFLYLNSGKLHKYGSRSAVFHLLNEYRCTEKAAVIAVLVHCNSRQVSKIFVVAHDYDSVCELTLIEADGDTTSLEDDNDSEMEEDRYDDNRTSDDDSSSSTEENSDDSVASSDDATECSGDNDNNNNEEAEEGQYYEEPTIPVLKSGLHYFNFILGDEVLDWQQQLNELQSPRIGFGALLPLLDTTNSRSSRRFALISSNWQVLDDKNSIQCLI